MPTRRSPLFTLAAGALLAGASSAAAQQVQYYTVGTFSSSGTSTATFGGPRDPVVLTFLGGSATNPFTVDLASGMATASFGQIVTSRGGPIPHDVFGDFTLNVFQLGADGGSGTLVGALAGTITNRASGATLTVGSATPLRIGNVLYEFAAGAYALASRSTNGGVITVDGRVSPGVSPNAAVNVASVPEPASVVLTASGLLAIGVGARRRRTAASPGLTAG